MVSEPCSQLQPTFLLHRRPYSNSSLLLECFVAGAGRFPAIARGVSVRKGQGRRALYCGFYLNELLMRLLQRSDPHERLFALYADTLAQLAVGDSLEPLLRRFELSLLQELGYGMILDRDIETDTPIQPERHYHYRLEQGPAPADDGDEPVVTGATLLALGSGAPLSPTGIREARLLLRRVLARYLGDKPLKSRELFQAFQRSDK
jgi:DNA repair protein RecO (recombination protein O)